MGSPNKQICQCHGFDVSPFHALFPSTFMSKYSDFFSSGLLASSRFGESRAHTSTPSLPSPISSTSNDNQNSMPACSNEPAADTTTKTALSSSQTSRSRRRRSSLSASASPMGAIKSSARSAGAAGQRAMNTATSGRNRSGSIGSANNTVTVFATVGRGRSRSIGGSRLVPYLYSHSIFIYFVCYRIIHKAPPPPTVPLPPLPRLDMATPVDTCHFTPAPAALVSSQRPPLTQRVHPAENAGGLPDVLSLSSSSLFLTSEFAVRDEITGSESRRQALLRRCA
jgi:hypothetical protein